MVVRPRYRSRSARFSESEGLIQRLENEGTKEKIYELRIYMAGGQS